MSGLNILSNYVVTLIFWTSLFARSCKKFRFTIKYENCQRATASFAYLPTDLVVSFCCLGCRWYRITVAIRCLVSQPTRALRLGFCANVPVLHAMRERRHDRVVLAVRRSGPLCGNLPKSFSYLTAYDAVREAPAWLGSTAMLPWSIQNAQRSVLLGTYMGICERYQWFHYCMFFERIRAHQNRFCLVACQTAHRLFIHSGNSLKSACSSKPLSTWTWLRYPRPNKIWERSSNRSLWWIKLCTKNPYFGRMVLLKRSQRWTWVVRLRTQYLLRALRCRISLRPRRTENWGRAGGRSRVLLVNSLMV